MAGGSSARPVLVGPSVLVSSAPTSRAHPGLPTGLFRVTPRGKVQALLAGDVSPVSVAATGAAVGYPPDPRAGPLVLAASASRTVLPHAEAGGGCAALSPDGSLVAYVTGTSSYVQPSRHLLYTRIQGTLWVAETANLDRLRAVQAGSFATSECPQWSPTGNRLAYFAPQAEPVWALTVYDHGALPVGADPGGAWFGYAPVAKKQLVFRRPDGSLLRTVRLAFVPEVVAAAGKGGRINYPHGSY